MITNAHQTPPAADYAAALALLAGVRQPWEDFDTPYSATDQAVARKLVDDYEAAHPPLTIDLASTYGTDTQVVVVARDRHQNPVSVYVTSLAGIRTAGPHAYITEIPDRAGDHATTVRLPSDARYPAQEHAAFIAAAIQRLKADGFTIPDDRTIT